MITVAERNITKVWFEQHTHKIVDVKKRGGVLTHKNVFVPRHVILFLGLMYYFFWGGQNLGCIFLIGLLKDEVLKLHTLMFYLF